MTGLLPGTTPARGRASGRRCRRRRGGLCRRASPALRLARVRVPAALARARRAAIADLAALARNCRPSRRILAAACAFRAGAGLARTTVRLSDHEKLLFRVDAMSTTKESLAPRPAARIGWSGYCP